MHICRMSTETCSVIDLVMLADKMIRDELALASRCRARHFTTNISFSCFGSYLNRSVKHYVDLVDQLKVVEKDFCRVLCPVISTTLACCPNPYTHPVALTPTLILNCFRFEKHVDPS